MEKSAPTFAAVYRCPTCNKEHPTEALAHACYESTPKPTLKVGDIVIIRQGYMWNDGLDHWVVGGHGRVSPIQGAESLAFYFVITSIDAGDSDQCHWDMHRNLYSVQTLGLKNGMPEGRGGWNPRQGHCPMELVENPPAQVVEESKALIGNKFYNLL